jgi:hypothetical protein
MVAMALMSTTPARAFNVPIRRLVSSTSSRPLSLFSSYERFSKTHRLAFFPSVEKSSSILAMSTVTTTDKSSSAPILFDSKYDIENKSKGIVGKYEPQLFEDKIYKWWEDAGCFMPDAKQSKEESSSQGREPYVLPMPPPNVTGRLHMGHAIFVALQDVLARFHRMRGRPVLWLPGE